ncbi:hypothetical protein RB595_004113 [Gaeumannomyces hyphopodioides]
MSGSPEAQDAGKGKQAEGELVSVTVTLGAQTKTFTFPADDSTVDDLSDACAEAFDDASGARKYNWSTHKFIAPQPVGLVRGAEQGGTLLSQSLAGKKVRLMASRLAEVDALRAAEAEARDRDAGRASAAQAARRRRHQASSLASRPKPKQSSGSSAFTFLSLRPLAYLPRPEASLRFLERLRDDPGVRAVMEKRRFTVGLLTEMDPAAHTDVSHEGVGRTLGLNRNRGEVIELRLRTDAGDGYRDYRTIRKTLCHELAHNVHGPHDAAFWDLCHAIEREVAAADWRGGAGRTVGDGPGFDVDDVDDDDDHAYDHGGWTGGEYVLGGAGSGPTAQELTRREILANAAEERHKRIVQERREPKGTSEAPEAGEGVETQEAGKRREGEGEEGRRQS